MTELLLREGEILQEVNENIRLIERADGLTFGTDAYLLAAYVRPRARGMLVDLGSGTGIIPLLCLSRGKASRCVAVEIQPDFSELIGRNAVANGFGQVITPLCADVRDIKAATVGGEADTVTANPPYMTVSGGARNQSDAKNTARRETAGGIADFCSAAGRLLKDGGRFYCVFRPDRMVDLITSLRAARLEPKRMTLVQATASASPSLLLVEAIKHAAPALLLTPPLFLHMSDPNSPEKPLIPLTHTPDTAYIYENCAFPARFTGTNRKP